MDTLSIKDRKEIIEKPSNKLFRFGDGKIHQSNKSSIFPIYTGSQREYLQCEVVECDIPLLLSKDSMKKAKAQLNFEEDTISFLNESLPIHISKSGHYCISLVRHRPPVVVNLLTSYLDANNPDQLVQQIKKLHRQFNHPMPDRLKKLISDSNISDPTIMKCVDTVSKECDLCKRFKKPPSRPTVGFPTASTFNEVVAMDLKLINGVLVLHMIDHATRYSAACPISNKKKETIVQAIMENWIKVFGPPKSFLTDNGGEFINDHMIDFAEQFNISLKTTAAESAWSNGLCERHNEILADLVRKTIADTGCNMTIAICWALSSKNALSNVFGFSPNQLVFGKNIDLPLAHTNKLPALTATSINSYMRNTLNALHVARKSFIQQEASDKLKRALSRQTREYTSYAFNNGDDVYYLRNNSKEWHGPAKVLGRDGQQYLLKHGGVYIRVHPCRLQACGNDHIEAETSAHKPELITNPAPSDKVTAPTQDLSDGNESDHAETEEEIESMDNAISTNDDTNHVTNLLDAPTTTSQIPLALRRLQNFNQPGKNEVTEDILFGSEAERDRFNDAKSEEIQKWREMDTFEEVQDTGQTTLSCRWVCTEKIKNNVPVLKARLVVRGFEEDTTQIKKDSPTCNKESICLLICILS